MTRAAPGLGSPLAAALEAQLGESVAVTAVERLKGGYSRQMWAFEATIAGGPARRLILCADNPAGVVDGDQALGRADEFRLLRVLGAAGLPVPPVLCCGDGSEPLGRPYLVMPRVEGTTAGGPVRGGGGGGAVVWWGAGGCAPRARLGLHVARPSPSATPKPDHAGPRRL